MLLVSVSKGIEKDTSLTLTDAIAQEVGEGHPMVGLLSTPRRWAVASCGGVPASRDKAAAELGPISYE